jgi:hypothetical protein
VAQDDNLKSYNGPDDNGQTLVLNQDLDASKLNASAVKCSTGLEDFSLTVHGTVTGGGNACVDVNNKVQGAKVYADLLVPTGEFVATVKGGSGTTKPIELGGTIRGSGKAVGVLGGVKWLKWLPGALVGRVDVIGGDWSDQSHDWVKLWKLAYRKEDGQPVCVMCLAAVRPEEEPGTGPYKYRFPHPDRFYHPFVVWCFETLRRWGLWRSESNASQPASQGS